MSSACFSSLWNRWTTQRRFQKRARPENYCRLACGGEAEDSIEHYARCPRVRRVGMQCLRLQNDQINVHTFMLCNPLVKTQQDLISTALLIYAIYRATNCFRHSGIAPTENYTNDALEQWTNEGAKGHYISSRTLDSRWMDGQRDIILPKIPLVIVRSSPEWFRRKRERSPTIADTVAATPRQRVKITHSVPSEANRHAQ